MKSLPYGRQWVEKDDLEQVCAVLEGDYLTTGPMVEDFEQALVAHTGADHAVAVNSGTAALHAAYFAAGLGPGDEIVTSPLTFAATANAARFLGASVRFVDVDPETGLMDPQRLEEAITPRTRLIVPVDYAGHPADYVTINTIARRHGLVVVADACHSLGARYSGRPVGTLADLTCLSFHPVKPITTGEGGAVLTDRLDWADRARRFRSHGIIRDRADFDPWYYAMEDLGYNYRLTDIQASLGLSQLKKLDRFLDRRRQIATRYGHALSDIPGLVLPVVRRCVDSGWHLYVVRVPDAAFRKPFFERLQARGLSVQVHYIPVYWHPYYQRLGYRKGLCPNAEDFYARAVSLPIFPKMTDADVDRVIETVHDVAREVWA